LVTQIFVKPEESGPKLVGIWEFYPANLPLSEFMDLITELNLK